LFFYWLGFVELSTILNLMAGYGAEFSEWASQDQAHKSISAALLIYSAFNLIFVSFSMYIHIRHIYRNPLLSPFRRFGWLLGLLFLPFGLGIVFYWSSYGRSDPAETHKKIASLGDDPGRPGVFRFNPAIIRARNKKTAALATAISLLPDIFLFSRAQNLFILGLAVSAFTIALLWVVMYFTNKMAVKKASKWLFTLDGEGLLFSAGEKSQFVRYADMKRITVYPSLSFFNPNVVIIHGANFAVSVFYIDDFMRQLRSNLGSWAVIEYK